MSENDNAEKIKKNIEIGLSGIWRFYDEGFTRWPYDKLASVFSNMNLEHPEIQRQFRALESQGFIKLHKKGECYIEVIRAPEA